MGDGRARTTGSRGGGWLNGKKTYLEASRNGRGFDEASGDRIKVGEERDGCYRVEVASGVKKNTTLNCKRYDDSARCMLEEKNNIFTPLKAMFFTDWLEMIRCI